MSFRMNPSLYQPAVQNELGMKYHDYLTRLHIDKAKTLLAATRKSICEISGEAGFHDYRVFTKVLRAWGRVAFAYRNRFCNK